VNNSISGMVRGPLTAWQIAGAAASGGAAEASPAATVAANMTGKQRRLRVCGISMSRRPAATAYSSIVLA